MSRSFLFVFIVVQLTQTVVQADVPLGYFSSPQLVFQNDSHTHSPWVSEDGFRLYFSDDQVSDGPWVQSATDIFMASRDTKSTLFLNQRSLGDKVNHDGHEDCCFMLTPDERNIVFFSEHADLVAESTLVSTRTGMDQMWTDPTMLFHESFGEDLLMSMWDVELSTDGLRAYFTGRSLDTDEIAVYFAQRGSPLENFSEPEVILVDPDGTRNQSISKDELTIFYNSNSFVQLRAATRSTTTEPFDEPISIDDFGIGSEEDWEAAWTPYVSRDWPAAGSKLYFAREDWNLYESAWILLGDINQNSMFDPDDFDKLAKHIVDTGTENRYDLNRDDVVDGADLGYWVGSLANTWIGDSNLDGEFNSGDLVTVFQIGKYEVDVNAGWADGDWNGDQRFDSADLVIAFQDGGYELGPRQAVSSVPEPTNAILLMTIGLIFLGPMRFRHGHS